MKEQHHAQVIESDVLRLLLGLVKDEQGYSVRRITSRVKVRVRVRVGLGKGWLG